MGLLKTMRRAWRRVCGWHDCSACGEQYLRFHVDNPIHPDGPPIFVWWACHACGAESETCGSPMMDYAARSRGYADFNDLLLSKVEERAPADGASSASTTGPDRAPGTN